MRKSYKFLPIVLTCSLLFSGCSFFGIDFGKKDTNNNLVEEQKILDDYSEIENLFEYSYDLDDNDDYDEDGLTNGQEKELGTNPLTSDTDVDGLSDGYEVNISKTNPLEKDSDNDGVFDGIELSLELDPLNEKTDGNINDGDRKFDMEFEIADKATLTISGGANISTTYSQPLSYCNSTQMPGVISPIYEFYLDGASFDEAIVTFPYDKNKLKKLGYEPNDISIYQFLDDGTFEKVGGEIDEKKSTISVSLPHFSKYVVAINDIIEQEVSSKVFILLDNSGSMYPEEMCEGSEANDVDFKRVDLAQGLIRMTEGQNVYYGLSKFTKTYTELASGFDNNDNDLIAKLESIKTEPEEFNGTYIATSLMETLKNFDENDIGSKKFILILTDGATTENIGLNFCIYNESSVIREANKKNVSILVIGLGAGVDTDYLTKIADGTNGLYVYANNSDALETLYDKITISLNYNYADLDGDGKNDSILVGDSGYKIDTNGFSFENYRIENPFKDNDIINGQCAGLAYFSQLYYLGKLPMKMDKVEKYHKGIYQLEGLAYDLSQTEFFGGEGEYVDNKKNLKDFKFFPDINDYFENKTFWEYRHFDANDNGYLKYSDEIYERVNNNPLVKIETRENPNGWNITKDGVTTKVYKLDSILYTVNNIDYDKLTKEQQDEYNILCAFNHFYASQGLTEDGIVERYSTRKAGYDNGARENAFDAICDALNRGYAVAIDGPEHTINAISMYRDIKDPSKFTIYAYDNNDPNNIKTIELKIEPQNFTIEEGALHSWWQDYKYTYYDMDNVFGQGEGAVVDLDFSIYKN